MNIFVIYCNRKVKVIDMVIKESTYVKLPIIAQVKVKYKEDGEWFDEWVDASKVNFDI